MTPNESTPFQPYSNTPAMAPSPPPPPPTPPQDPVTTQTNDLAGQEVLSKVVRTAHEAIDRLAEQAGPHVDRLQRGLIEGKQQLHLKADQVKQAGNEYTESARVTVRNNPLTSVAGAFLLGALLARLLR